jgi:hypothetical protein
LYGQGVAVHVRYAENSAFPGPVIRAGGVFPPPLFTVKNVLGCIPAIIFN